ncbi:MAG: hypothetical protein AABW81_01210 [Nanoarchaeota archaeon]
MTTIEEHKKIVKEFLDDINEKIKANLLTERQKIIGFASSEAAVNLFAIFLHKKKIIEPSFSINHRYFASLKIAENKFNFNFINKEKILNLLVDQESYRNKLCYGKEKDADIVNSAVKNLFELKMLIESELEEK